MDTKGRDPEVAVRGRVPRGVGRAEPIEVGRCRSEHGPLLFLTAAIPSMRTLWSPPGWVEAFGNDAHGGPGAVRAPFHCRGINTLNVAGDSRKSGSRGLSPESFEVCFHTNFVTSQHLQSR